MFRAFFLRHKMVIIYGCSLAALLLLMRWLEIRLLLLSHAQDVYFGAIALIFTCLGIWLALKIATPKKEVVVVEKTVYVKQGGEFVRNESAVTALNLSPRETEVLELMATGLSNAEIAGKLFVSLNTIKTHSSKVYEKLEVKRRTQAIEKARQLGVIA